MSDHRPHPSTESEELFDVVRRAIDGWVDQAEFVSNTGIENSLKGHIRRDLRRTPFDDLADAIDVPKYNRLCDIVVDDRIAIKIIRELHDGSKEWIHNQLRHLLDDYDYLVIYGHQISAEYADLWRQIKRSLYRYTGSQDRILVVGTIDNTQYSIPMTSFSVSGTILRKFGVYGIFFLFVLSGSAFLESANGGAQMGGVFIAAVIIFNAVVISMVAFLLRCL